MNHSEKLSSLSKHDLQQVSGGFSLSDADIAKYGCILYVPGYPKENPVVPGPSSGITE